MVLTSRRILDKGTKALSFQNATKNMGLQIHENKTKFLAATKEPRAKDAGQNISIGDYNSRSLDKP